MKKEHINPKGLIQSPAFSHAVITTGPGKTIYIGGQNAVNEQAEVVGINDLALQTEQVMKNIGITLTACKADFNDLVKLTIHILQGEDARVGFEVSQRFLKECKHPPAITVLFVSSLVNPAFLVEIDAIAFVA